jgi:hypothetical protein
MLAVVMLSLSACGWLNRQAEPWQSNLNERDIVRQCSRFFVSLDERVANAGVADAQYTRIEGYPYLRVDRFLASFRYELADSDKFAAWVRAAQARDREARGVELTNLPDSARTQLQSHYQQTDLAKLVAYCGDQLMTWDMSERDRRRQLLTDMDVAQGYSSYARAMGLYPLTRHALERYYQQWQAELRAEFNRGRVMPTGVRIIDYVPAIEPEAEAAVLSLGTRTASPLGIPQLSAEDQRSLIERHAPIWRIQTQDDADKLGVPALRRNRLAAFHYDEPTAYSLLSYTRFNKEILLQISYSVWFSERPALQKNDPHSGRLDGLIWRVTLDREGAPLLFDLVNASGQYHILLPTDRLQTRKGIEAAAGLIVALPQGDWAASRPIITVAAQTHQLIGLAAAESTPVGTRYEITSYHTLRQLPQLNGGTRSLFNPQGLVEGTERGVGIFQWPTGIPAPGAMRQWGNHITSFSSERHFDEARMIEHYFTRSRLNHD